LKRLVLFLNAILLVLQAQAAPLAFIVLNTASWGSGRLPSDWQIRVKDGRPDISVCRDSDVPCLHLKSQKSSYSLEHSVNVDPAEMPLLAWRWKVTQLPSRGDFRHATTDDQAAQVLVAFEDRRVLAYIWDTNAPRGAFQSASSIPFVHIYALVCRSGDADANRWVDESHNVAADYERAFGKPAPRVKGLRIQINSQHTGSTAESYFGEIAFRSAQQ
jgi:hypothetical protein